MPFFVFCRTNNSEHFSELMKNYHCVHDTVHRSSLGRIIRVVDTLKMPLLPKFYFISNDGVPQLIQGVSVEKKNYLNVNISKLEKMTDVQDSDFVHLFKTIYFCNRLYNGFIINQIFEKDKYYLITERVNDTVIVFNAYGNWQVDATREKILQLY